MKREQLAATLPQADQAGVFSLPARDVPGLTEVATAAGFAVYRVALGGCSDSGDVLARLGEQLAFPAWYGENWDALADCLSDFSWREAPGYVLVLEQLGDFRAAGDADFDTLIEVLSEASASWAVMGIPFWAFLITGP
ncbi:MAG: barstar family protein [Gammaproteobacteria bacterium]|nr:barstar family protein [Gammaproteobacteria bacterium]